MELPGPNNQPVSCRDTSGDDCPEGMLLAGTELLGPGGEGGSELPRCRQGGGSPRGGGKRWGRKMTQQSSDWVSCENEHGKEGGKDAPDRGCVLPAWAQQGCSSALGTCPRTRRQRQRRRRRQVGGNSAQSCKLTVEERVMDAAAASLQAAGLGGDAFPLLTMKLLGEAEGGTSP